MKWYFAVFLFLVACSVEPDDNQSVPVVPQRTDLSDVDSAQIRLDSTVKANLLICNLVDIQQYNAGILVDLKYATADNFMKEQLYDSLNTAYLQKDVAERLVDCQKLLDSLHPGYKLLHLARTNSIIH